MRITGKLVWRVLIAMALDVSQSPLVFGQLPPDTLVRGFDSPPDVAKPRVWWHWMNGNITPEGIKLDLEWMRRIGIGGAQTFDAAFDTPQIVNQRLVFMTPPWNEAFRTAASLAGELGLELAIASSPGWSESGGPWVKAEEGMKKLVWTETLVTGGIPFSGRLPRPPATTGPFQDVAVYRDPNSYAGVAPVDVVPDLYRDVAVVAYRLPDSDRPMAELQPHVTSSAGPVDSHLLWDGRYDHAINLPYDDQHDTTWLQVDFGRALAVQSMVLALHQSESTVYGPRYVGAELQSSSDGIVFRPIATAFDSGEYVTAGLPPVQQTVTFEPIKSRYFRLVLPKPPKWQLSSSLASVLVPPDEREHQIAEFVLSPAPRVNHIEQKAGFFLENGLSTFSTRRVSSRDVIRRSDVVDLSGKLSPDGSLNWTPPSGRWAVLRVGYSLLGPTNRPATPEGTGLEVDKLSRYAVEAYMQEYLHRYESILGPRLIGERGLKAMITDSYEVGAQNWTSELPSEFLKRRGYDLHPWLPALTGRIIGSAELTDQFLWDFRRTLGELIAENHYGQIAASLHSRGMTYYGESHENGRAFIGDGMDVKRDDDIPMAAMWVPDSGLGITQEMGDADIRESASVAHIYGQNLAAAESMTAFGTSGAAFSFAPENLKSTADRELADGLNLFVIHTSAHQPLIDRPPGVTLGPFGQWFTRNETWAEDAGPWVKYLTRSSYLLQQGHFVADVVYYYGQDSNITALFGSHLPPIPEGYAFDFASAHALTKLSTQNGCLVTASGMKYRILALDSRAKLMSLDVLQTIARLVHAGATVVGNRPEATPSLSDNPAEFRKLVRLLWKDDPTGEHHYGRGRVLSGRSIAQALEFLRIPPDFHYSNSPSESGMQFVHRQLRDGEIYFVSNPRDRAETLEAEFRVIGKEPELWRADTGSIEPVSYRQEGDRTLVPLSLESHDAVFVVFRKIANRREQTIPTVHREQLYSLSGPWSVRFQEHRGAPAIANFRDLQSWTTNTDPGIRYFSGTATYEKAIDVPSAWMEVSGKLEMDLGSVKSLAEVLINDVSAGVVWKFPFRTDIKKLLHVGRNRVTVRVTNLWPNRLIGDKQPGAVPVAMTTLNPYSADSPLLESGLLGPVRILRADVTETPH